MAEHMRKSHDAAFKAKVALEALKGDRTMAELSSESMGCARIKSVQGSQFTSNDFTEILARERISISMDGRGRAYDNIFVERLWRSVKYDGLVKSRKMTIFEN